MTSPETGHPTFSVRRPHRADAARNFDALVAAARAAFGEHGLHVPLENIARRAGVGIGTLYRNFPTRQHLVNSVFEAEIEQLCTVAEDVTGLPPWEALTTWLRRFVGYETTKRSIYEAIDLDSEMFQACRVAMHAAGAPILRRAQEAGEARDDVDLDDILRMIIGIGRGLFRDDAQLDRVLTMAFDGIRAPGKR